MDIFLSYPSGCICEVVHDAMMVALFVAGHARASALHTTQSWIELGRFQVIAINHVRQVIAINHARAEVMQPDVLLSAFSDLPGSCVQERWRRSALLAQGPPRLVVLLCERVGAAERVGGGVVAFAVRGPRRGRLYVRVRAIALVSIVNWGVLTPEVNVDVWVAVRRRGIMRITHVSHRYV